MEIKLRDFEAMQANVKAALFKDLHEMGGEINQTVILQQQRKENSF